MSESGHAKPQGDPLSEQHRDEPAVSMPVPDSAALGHVLHYRPLDPLAVGAAGTPLHATPAPSADQATDPLGAGLTPPLPDPPDTPPRGAGPADDDDDPTIRRSKPPVPVDIQAAGEPAVPDRRFASWARTDVGSVRKHNEDSLVDRPDLGLWAVADGAGGHSRGDVASRMVAEALEGLPPNLSASQMLAEVRQRMTETNAALRATMTPPEISASTLVVLIARGDHFACLWAGDSRLYLLRAGIMTQVTRDHSLVQEMVEAGAIRAEDAESHPNANVITRAIGSGDELDLEKVTDRLLPGDRFLLCSDGLCKTLPDSLTAQLLADNDDPAGKLIQATLEHRGRDNVTAVVVDVVS
jgi:protein phosphatase/serine/threonine-protein phosphatase Stp1